MRHGRLFVLVFGVVPCIAFACAQVAGISAVPVPVDAGPEVKAPPDGAACEAGQTQCSSNAVETCDEAGVWDEDSATQCVSSTCEDAACTGVCAPGQIACADGGALQSCTAGTWVSTTSCASTECTTNGPAAGIGCAGSTSTGQSCAGTGDGLTNCGPDSNDNCCRSIEVQGGSFYRSYDNKTLLSKAWPATVSGLRIDKYLVTVGRFRQWVNLFDGGTPPLPMFQGAGIHSHLNGGAGLNDGTSTTGHEIGWQVSWNSSQGIATTVAEWDANLGMSPDGGGVNGTCGNLTTWTVTPGTGSPKRPNHESLPINCVSWYEAYAFCIWDAEKTGGEGFLPSEAEWNYVAAGGGMAGNGQRVYAFSDPPDSTGILCSQADFMDCLDGGQAMGYPENVGDTLPAGAGLWGHADLTGNLWEWTLDLEYASAASDNYPTPCVDCTATTVNGTFPERERRGGAYYESPGAPGFPLTVSARSPQPPQRQDGIGFRCARTP